MINFLNQVLPKENVRKYVIRLLSSFLSGKTGSEKFHIWTGCGGNGKSKLIELFRNSFGEYCCTLPVSIITQKRGRAEGPSPALAGTLGKRFACLQEPEGGEQINVGLMKELTGGDKIKARKLHKDFFEFKPQFKAVLTCNVLPEVNADDNSTWRRIRCVEYPSKFVENPNPNNPYEFLIDETLDEKLLVWKEVFMYILLEEHKQYKIYGINEPDDVKRVTKEYQNDSDNFTPFIEEFIVELTDYTGEGLTLNEIYTIYQDWFKKARGSNLRVPKSKDIKKNLIKKFGQPTNSTWYGITLKNSGYGNEVDNDI